MGLIDRMRNMADKKKKDNGIGEAEFDVMYSTGFLPIDYLNGTLIYVESEERNFKYDSVGIVDGSTNTIIGRSGSGKSTLMTQICGNIIRPFIEKGLPVEYYNCDIESSLPTARKEFLLGLTKEQLHDYVYFKNTGITTEYVYETLCAIRDEKLSNRSKYEYDTGKFDIYGNRIFKLVPTLFSIDSFAMLMPKEIAEDDGFNVMDASGIAKKNTQLVKKISQLCKECNIILFTINHIMDDINMGFIPKAAQISGLKKGERLPGGKAAIYLANNMFRVDDSLTLKPEKDLGIDGSVITFTVIKSRTNTSKKTVPLIFNKTEGRFDDILSMYYLLKQEGKISGAGVSMYIDGYPDVKFSQKKFKEVLENNPDLQKVFARTCYDILKTYLSTTRAKRADNSSASAKIIDMFNEFSLE